MNKIDSLVIVGSTCSGKTSAVRSLRDYYGKQLIFPLRYVTRPQRKNDDLVENRPTTLTAFKTLVDKGLIDIWWQRHMEGDRIELYGFESFPSLTKLKIYSANNAIVRDQDASLKNLGTYKILAMQANYNTRAQRLFVRSPDLSKEEVEYRLGDNGTDLIKKADYVIDTSNTSSEQVLELSKDIVNSFSQ